MLCFHSACVTSENTICVETPASGTLLTSCTSLQRLSPRRELPSRSIVDANAASNIPPHRAVARAQNAFHNLVDKHGSARKAIFQMVHIIASFFLLSRCFRLILVTINSLLIDSKSSFLRASVREMFNFFSVCC